MEEMWDLYDRNRRKMDRQAERGTELKGDEHNLVVEIWTMNYQGEILMTKRHPLKYLGNRWEFTGGAVVAGETSVQAAVRELLEETGIRVTEDELIYLVTDEREHSFMDIYVTFQDMTVADLVLQPEEVVDARWVGREQYDTMCRNEIVAWPVVGRFKRYRKQLDKIVEQSKVFSWPYEAAHA